MVRLAYQAIRERRGVWISLSRPSYGPFFVTELRFPTAHTAASVSRIGFPISLVINNGRATPLVVERVGLDDSTGSCDKPIGGMFRHLALKHGVLTLSGPVSLPIQIGPHDALALSGVFQVAVPSDVGRPLFGLYCSRVSQDRMKKWVIELQSEIVRKVNLGPLGVELASVEVPEMYIQDPLLEIQEHQASASPKFGEIDSGAYVSIMGYCQQHALPLPRERVPAKSLMVVKFTNRKPVIFELNHATDPLWFLSPLDGE